MNKAETVDQAELARQLILIYSRYTDDSLDTEAMKKAKDLDGLWSGGFLFDRAVEVALLNLSNVYGELKLNKERAKEILEELKKSLKKEQ
ncbi:MAG: hypothetical protein V1659_02160 [Candidatus Woesearchaeota archaeon]